VQNSVDRNRQFELNMLWYTQPMQRLQMLGDMVELPQIRQLVEHRLYRSIAEYAGRQTGQHICSRIPVDKRDDRRLQRRSW